MNLSSEIACSILVLLKARADVRKIHSVPVVKASLPNTLIVIGKVIIIIKKKTFVHCGVFIKNIIKIGNRPTIANNLGGADKIDMEIIIDIDNITKDEFKT